MIFKDLTDDEIAQVEKLGTLRVYEPGSSILSEGFEGTSFGLIVAGKVEVRKRLQDGRCKRLVELGPADVIGELGFLGAPCRSASIVALSECRILEFSRERFESFLTDFPETGLRVYRGMARELAQRLVASDENLLTTIAWTLEHREDDMQTAELLEPSRRHKLGLKKRPR